MKYLLDLGISLYFPNNCILKDRELPLIKVLELFDAENMVQAFHGAAPSLRLSNQVNRVVTTHLSIAFRLEKRRFPKLVAPVALPYVAVLLENLE